MLVTKFQPRLNMNSSDQGIQRYCDDMKKITTCFMSLLNNIIDWKDVLSYPSDLPLPNKKYF